MTYADFLLHHTYHNLSHAFKKADSGIDFDSYTNINRVVKNYREHEKLKSIVEETDKLPYYPPGFQKLNW